MNDIKGAPTPVKESELGSLLNQLESVVGKMQNDTGGLQKQLDPLLSASRPDKEVGDKALVASCEVSHRVEGLISMVEIIDRAIVDMRERLAL